MRDLLLDDSLFKNEFCSETTLKNLGGAKIYNLRQVLLKMYDEGIFHAAASPQKWTPEGSAQPIVVFGRLSEGWTMLGPRFGLCAKSTVRDDVESTGIFLWFDIRQSYCGSMNISEQVERGFLTGWRDGSDGPTDTRWSFYMVAKPLCSGETGLSEYYREHTASGKGLSFAGILHDLKKIVDQDPGKEHTPKQVGQNLQNHRRVSRR